MGTRTSVPAVDPQAAIGVARSVESRIAAQRSRFEALASIGEGEAQLVARYPALVAAAATAAAEYTKVTAEEGDFLVPVKLVGDATTLRARMLKCADYVLGGIESVRAVLDAIRLGTGYRDLASDLAGLSQVYSENAVELQKDGVHYRATDAAEALRFASEIQAARVDAMGPPAKKAGERWGKAFGELRAAHDVLVDVGRFLDRKEPDPARHYPSLFAVALQSAPKPKKAKGSPSPGPA